MNRNGRLHKCGTNVQSKLFLHEHCIELHSLLHGMKDGSVRSFPSSHESQCLKRLVFSHATSESDKCILTLAPSTKFQDFRHTRLTITMQEKRLKL